MAINNSIMYMPERQSAFRPKVNTRKSGLSSALLSQLPMHACLMRNADKRERVMVFKGQRGRLRLLESLLRFLIILQSLFSSASFFLFFLIIFFFFIEEEEKIMCMLQRVNGKRIYSPPPTGGRQHGSKSLASDSLARLLEMRFVLFSFFVTPNEVVQHFSSEIEHRRECQ